MFFSVRIKQYFSFSFWQQEPRVELAISVVTIKLVYDDDTEWE